MAVMGLRSAALRAAKKLRYKLHGALVQLRINFTHTFKGAKLPKSPTDEGYLENLENTSKINP